MVYENDVCERCGVGRIHYTGQKFLLNEPANRGMKSEAFRGYACDHCSFRLVEEGNQFIIEAIFRNPMKIR